MSLDNAMTEWIRDIRDFSRVIDENIRSAESQLHDLVVEGIALDGGVIVKLNSANNVETIVIDPDLYTEIDAEGLADAVRHAFANARQELSQQRRRINLGVIGL